MTAKIFLVCFGVCFFTSNLVAQEWSFEKTKTDMGGFVLGVLGGIMFHEVGHWTVARSRNYQVSHKGVSIIYPDLSVGTPDQKVIASSGFHAQWLLAEGVFLNHQFHQQPMDNLEAGLIVSHLAISAAYLTILKNHPEGDLVGIAEATQYSTDTLALIFAIPAFLDGWRLLGNEVPTYVPILSQTTKGLVITATWAF